MSVIYCSPSQNNSEFDSFLSNLERLLRDISKCNPTVSVIAGDFTARSSSWWSEDINTSVGTKLYSLINEPTHIQINSSSCTDLVFTDQLNLSVNSVESMHLYIQTVIIKLYILNLILIFPTPTIPASYTRLQKGRFRKN